ncbi:hypothetical protein [Promicromonospora sp. NPDC023987]|uniref:hypothetical protein n=1 Tax=Promicromonospora sp. NPDC023987 TaxID=3155360 RepID=UPI0033D485A2
MRITQVAHPGAEVTFVDVPRLATPSSRDHDLTGYDEWRMVAGDDLAQLLGDAEREARVA